MNFIWIISSLAMVAPLEKKELPAVVRQDVDNLAFRATATMTYWGFDVYDVSLWTPPEKFSYDQPFALELHYKLSFEGRDIAERSVKEIREQGFGDEPVLQGWGEQMARVFPDVKSGDVLIGVYVPNREARFYSKGKLIGVVFDPGFARRFFDIWLSPKTSEPKLRKILLGL